MAKKKRNTRSQIRQLASILAMEEGGATQSRVMDVQTHLSTLSDLAHKNPNWIAVLIQNGARRAKRRRK